jgi:predicted transposase YdaD
VLDFYYTSIRLWEVDPEKFTRPGREGILPLVLLTTGNGNIEVLDMVIDALMAADKQELLPITEMLASLIFQEKPDELEKCKRRFAVLRDIMRETPGYQQIWQEGLEKGREEGLVEGREEGIQEGKLRALRKVLVNFVQAKFPDIVTFAEYQVNSVKSDNILQNKILEVSFAETEEEMLRVLSAMSKVQSEP